MSISDSLSKKILFQRNPYTVAMVRLLYGLPLLLVFAPVAGVPKLDTVFWIVISIGVPLDLIAMLLYLRSIKGSPLSLTLPFLGLSPIFLIGVSYILLGEIPSILAVGGIFLISAGIYCLNAHESGFLAPFKAITKEKGSMLMIAVSFIYSITATLAKVAVLHSSPMFYAASYYTFLAILMSLVVMIKSPCTFRIIFSQPKDFIPLGLAYAIMLVIHYHGLQISNVAYFIAVKRTSILMGVLWGWVFFHEKNIRERMFGSVLIIIGTILISL